jgi:hypothetical protein
MNRVKFIKSIAKYLSNAKKTPDSLKTNVAMDNPIAYMGSTGQVPPFDAKNKRFDMTDSHSNIKNDKIKEDFLEGKDNVFQNKDVERKIGQKDGEGKNQIPKEDKVNENPEVQISS